LPPPPPPPPSMRAPCGRGPPTPAVTQTIKDVVQSLVDDGMVDLEKIGSANYYWSFQTKALCGVRGAGRTGVPDSRLRAPIAAAVLSCRAHSCPAPHRSGTSCRQPRLRWLPCRRPWRGWSLRWLPPASGGQSRCGWRARPSPHAHTDTPTVDGTDLTRKRGRGRCSGCLLLRVPPPLPPTTHTTTPCSPPDLPRPPPSTIAPLLRRGLPSCVG
jgi:hypothetical protein